MRVGLGGVFDEVAEDIFVVVAHNEDFLDLRKLCNGLETVLDDWVTGDFEEWLVGSQL